MINDGSNIHHIKNNPNTGRKPRLLSALFTGCSAINVRMNIIHMSLNFGMEKETNKMKVMNMNERHEHKTRTAPVTRNGKIHYTSQSWMTR